MLAAQCGHEDVIKSLLEKKANPNITGKVGLSVLATGIIVWIISFAVHCARIWKDTAN
jgi:ankyrin repeat protein